MPTILLVQTDSETREISSEWLRHAGFFVLDCTTGEEALSLASLYKATIDVIVTELSLPCTNGMKLIDELRKQRSELRALVLSGASIPVDFGAQELTFLKTPCEHPALVQMIRDMVA